MFNTKTLSVGDTAYIAVSGRHSTQVRTATVARITPTGQVVTTRPSVFDGSRQITERFTPRGYLMERTSYMTQLITAERYAELLAREETKRMQRAAVQRVSSALDQVHLLNGTSSGCLNKAALLLALNAAISVVQTTL